MKEWRCRPTTALSRGLTLRPRCRAPHSEIWLRKAVLAFKDETDPSWK